MAPISPSIPIIDLSLPKVEVVKQIKAAMTTVGFMYVKNHEIPQHEIDTAFQLSKEMFDCPLEEKLAFPRDMTTDDFYQIGYCGIGQENLDPEQPGDLKECLDCGDFDGKSYLKYMPPSVQERWDKVLHFQTFCKSLRDKLLVYFALAMNLPEEYFLPLHQGEDDVLRFLLYTPKIPGDDNVQQDQKKEPIGAGAHSDYGTMTLLFQDEVGGLQVQSREQTWVDAQVIPDTILVNLGDALQFWTKNLLKSTVHRVQIPPRQRYSIAYFVEPDPDVVLAQIREDGVIDTSGQEKILTSREWLTQRLAASQAL